MSDNNMTVEAIINLIWQCGYDIFNKGDGFVLRAIRRDAKMNNMMRTLIKERRDDIESYVRQVQDEIAAKWHRKPEEAKPTKTDW